MSRKQLFIALQIAAALVACVVVWRAGLGRGPAVEVATAERLALAARWLVVPALCLMAGVGVIANTRFFSPGAIDGGEAPAGSRLEITRRYALNTLEQTVLAAIAWSGVALSLPARDLSLIPALAALFAAGRATFWAGYLAAPWARGFGMGLTFYPTAAALVWLAFRLLT